MPLVGTDATTAQSNFDTAHPLYRQIAELARIRSATPALRRGRQVTRHYGREAGLVAFSRFDPDTGREVVAVFNTSAAPVSGNVIIDRASSHFTALTGPCPATHRVPGSLAVALPAFGYMICAAQGE